MKTKKSNPLSSKWLQKLPSPLGLVMDQVPETWASDFGSALETVDKSCLGHIEQGAFLHFFHVFGIPYPLQYNMRILFFHYDFLVRILLRFLHKKSTFGPKNPTTFDQKVGTERE